MKPSSLPEFTLFVSVLTLLGFQIAPVQAAGPEVTWREIITTPKTPPGLLGSPSEFCEIAPPRSQAIEGVRSFTEALGDVYETFENPPDTHYFFCTVYYTPRESGFTKEGGFNVAPTKPRGLSQSFPADFVKATQIEGFGRTAEGKDSNAYLKYDGRWGYYHRILGNRNNTLLDRESIAVHRGNSLFASGRRVWILDPAFYNTFGALRFEVADTGGGLYRSQIDLYWGEDDPLGPGIDIWRPATCDVAVRWIVPVLIWN